MTSIKKIKHSFASIAIATALVAAGQVAVASSTASAQSQGRTVTLSIGKSKKLDYSSNIADVTVGDPNIARVEVKSARQIFVHARRPGETTVYVQNAAGKVIDQINIRVGQNLGSLDQMLSLAMPEADITITKMNGVVLLTGTVKQPEDVAEAERLVTAFTSNGGGGRPPEVVSRLKTATPLQVNLQVRFAEVSRSLAKEISSNFQTSEAGNNFLVGAARGRDFTNDAGQIVFPEGGNTIAGIGRLFGLDVAAAFDLSERAGLTTTLATPNLTTVSGETATFQAGGSFPIPTSSGFGTTSVQFQNFGVILEYTPTVLSDGRISLRLKPEVSDISSTGAVRINGLEIPAISTRTVETTVELGSGQSMMIAGLMQNSLQSSVEKIPGLGDIPILGALFRSPGWRKNETELVVVITPYLVKPVSRDQISLPTDGFHSANDAQRIFNNKFSKPGSNNRPQPTLESQTKASPDFKSISESQPKLPAPEKGKKPKQAAARSTGAGFSFE